MNTKPPIAPSSRRKKAIRKFPAKLDGSNALRYVDLPGRPGVTYCLNATSVSGCLEILKDRLPVSAAGDNGALNCYRDSEGLWRGVFCRRCVTRSNEAFGSLVDLAGWLKKWWPELGDLNKEARL